jgi:lambda family phage portal protein
VEAGEVFVVKNLKTGREAGKRLQLTLLEHENLAWDLTVNPDTGYKIVGGIEKDGERAPVAYWFYLDEYSHKATRLPAYRVLHIHKQMRPGASHGVTHFHAILRKMANVDMFDEFTLQAAAIEACIAILIQTENPVGGVPTFNPTTGEVTTTEAGNEYAEFDGGMVFRGKPGDKVQGMMPQRPGGQYVPYQQLNKRSLAAGVDLSYETVARDFTGGSYSSLRQSLVEDRRAYGVLQQLIIEQLLQPVYEEWLYQAVVDGFMDGVLDMGAFLAERKKWEYCSWHGQGWDWIDPRAEIEASCKAIDYQLTTREKDLAARGEDVGEVFRQRKIESDLAKEHGLVLPEEKDRQALRQTVLEGFIGDGTVADVVANAVDVGQLVSDAGLPRNMPYKEPYLPVTTDSGAAVTGEVVKDQEGDIVGGVASAPAGTSDPAMGQPGTPGTDQPAGAAGELEILNAQIEAYGVAVRAGVITPQLDDENHFRSKLGLPAINADAKNAWAKDEGARRPITLKDPPAEVATTPPPVAPVAPPQTPTPQDTPADEGGATE